MKLSEKGRFQARPALPLHAEALAERLGSWSNVQARTHWELGNEQVVDGADFYVGESELGHLHMDGTAHVPQPGPVAEALLAAKLARPFAWAENWVVAPVKSAAAVEHAQWLFQLQYDHLLGVATAVLVDRVRAKAAEGR